MAALTNFKPEGRREAALFEESVRLQRQLDKIKTEQKETDAKYTGKMLTGGTATLVAFGSGFLFAKYPKIATIGKSGKIQTRLLLGGASVLGAFMLEDEAGDIAEGAAYGFGLPFLHDWGVRVATS